MDRYGAISIDEMQEIAAQKLGDEPHVMMPSIRSLIYVF
jgi:hypothetical protein